jgi:hypothetical protein
MDEMWMRRLNNGGYESSRSAYCAWDWNEAESLLESADRDRRSAASECLLFRVGFVLELLGAFLDLARGLSSIAMQFLPGCMCALLQFLRGFLGFLL